MTCFMASCFANDQIDVQNNVTNSFFYGSVSAFNTGLIPFPASLIPGPALGVGYRYQYNYVGLDLCADCSPILITNLLRLAPSILFYPQPDIAKQFYLGLSCSEVFAFVPNIVCTSGPKGCHFFNVIPELVLGYQYIRASGKNNFIEFRLGAPVLSTELSKRESIFRKNDSSLIPKSIILCASIKFGFSF